MTARSSGGGAGLRCGEGWVTCELGHRHWGRHGAAGLLLAAEGSVLLQLRAGWSHHGGTWGVPGGALVPGERPLDGAFRESAEEAGIELPESAATSLSVAAHGGWSYTTVLAALDAVRPATPTDPESDELRWVPIGEVSAMPLHPDFAAAWPELARAVGCRLRLVVDAANVVGARPDGWWRDRAGAASRLRDALTDLQIPRGEMSPDLGLPRMDAWLPEVVLVVEGAARGVRGVRGGAVVVAAPAGGDDEVVRQAAASVALSGQVATLVVTSDRALQSRVHAVGTVTVGAGWLLRLLHAGDGPLSSR